VTARPAIPLLLGLLLLSCLSPARPAEAGGTRPRPVTVLLYHRFDDARYPSTNISKAALEEQLAFLKKEGYRFLDMPAFIAILEGRREASGREVLVTVDDGYRSVYEVAWPLFRREGVPFVLFLSTGPVEKGYRSIMTWEQIEEMAASGVLIANHTESHPHLGLREKGEDEAAYRARVRREIVTARDRLARHGISNPYFAYPYGEYNDVVRDEVRRAGYDLAFSQNPGVAYAGCDRMRVDRMAIVGGNMTLEAFRKKLSRLPLEARRELPAAVRHDGSIPGIRLRIAEPDRYRPGQVNLFLSEKGRLDHRYDRSTGLDVLVRRDFPHNLIFHQRPFYFQLRILPVQPA